MPLPRTSSFVPEAFENEHRIATIELSSISKSGGSFGAGGRTTGGEDDAAVGGTRGIVPVGEGTTGREDEGTPRGTVAEGAEGGRGGAFSAGSTPLLNGSAKYRLIKKTDPKTTRNDTAKIIGVDTAAFVRFKKSIY